MPNLETVKLVVESVASLGAVVAVIIATRQLKLQRDELAKQREELALQRAEFKATREVQKEQADHQESLAAAQQESADALRNATEAQEKANELTSEMMRIDAVSAFIRLNEYLHGASHVEGKPYAKTLRKIADELERILEPLAEAEFNRVFSAIAMVAAAKATRPEENE